MERGKKIDTETSRIYHSTRNDDSFEKLGSLIEVAKGALIATPSEQTEYCYYVKSGQVSALGYTSNGCERIWGLYEQGSMFLEAEAYMRYPTVHFYKAASACTLVCISESDLRQAVGTDISVAGKIIEQLSSSLYTSMLYAQEQKACSARWSTYNVLLDLANRYGTNRSGMTLIQEKMSQQKLANYIGINRVTLNRIMQELKKDGVIAVMNGYICVCDMKRLQQIRDDCC